MENKINKELLNTIQENTLAKQNSGILIFRNGI